MNILIHCQHFLVCSGRYYADAFKRAGHSVRSTGQAMGRNIWGMALQPALAWQPEPPGDGWKPDLIIYADSDPTILDTVIEGAPRIVVGVDNHVRDYRRPHFSHYFLAHKKYYPGGYHQPIEQTDETHLPCAYDPTVHTPSQIPYEQREYDVCMLGYPYPRRTEAIKALKDAGLKVMWGLGYVGESYAAAHHNSRISLCLSHNGDMAQRLFESAAMGCMVLTDHCWDFELHKPDGFYEMNGPSQAVKACEEILNYPHVAEDQIAKSQAWAKSHTWDNRVQTIVNYYEANHAHQRAEVR